MFKIVSRFWYLLLMLALLASCNLPTTGVPGLVTVTATQVPPAQAQQTEVVMPVLPTSTQQPQATEMVNPTATLPPTATQPVAVILPCDWGKIAKYFGGDIYTYVNGSGPISGPAILHDWDYDPDGPDGPEKPYYLGPTVFDAASLHYEPWVGGQVFEGQSIQWDERARLVVTTYPNDEAVRVASKFWLAACKNGESQGVLQGAKPLEPTPTP